MYNLMATENKVHKSKNNKSKRNLGFENAFKLNQKGVLWQYEYFYEN